MIPPPSILVWSTISSRSGRSAGLRVSQHQDRPQLQHQVEDLLLLSHFRIDHDIFPEACPTRFRHAGISTCAHGMARLNYDRTITPTLLLHAGIGFMHHYNPDKAPPTILNYDRELHLD